MSFSRLRTIWALILLMLATQLLTVGLEKLFLLQDVPILLAYQHAQQLGVDKALVAVEQATGKKPDAMIIALYMHQGEGRLLALVLGCMAAAGLVWRRGASWWLPPLVLLGSIALYWSGTQDKLKTSVFHVVSQAGQYLSLWNKLMVVGGLSIVCFLLLVTLASKALPPHNLAHAAAGPGPRSSA